MTIFFATLACGAVGGACLASWYWIRQARMIRAEVRQEFACMDSIELRRRRTVEQAAQGLVSVVESLTSPLGVNPLSPGENPLWTVGPSRFVVDRALNEWRSALARPERD